MKLYDSPLFIMVTVRYIDLGDAHIRMGHHYRQVSNISRTQSQNIPVSRLVLQLSLPNPLKPGVKLITQM